VVARRVVNGGIVSTTVAPQLGRNGETQLMSPQFPTSDSPSESAPKFAAPSTIMKCRRLGGRIALWQIGFRPFYALASVFAALSIAAWAAQFAGWLARPYLAGPLWHAHEMVFGFALAVMVGFLFTAVRNWTKASTPSGPLLALLASLWLAGRVMVVTPFTMAAAVVGPLFPLACAVAIWVPLVKARNTRNYFFVALLLAIAAADAVFFCSGLGTIEIAQDLCIQIALDIVLIVMAAIAGRVVPMFTNNGVAGAGAMSIPWLDRAALVLLVMVAVADAVRLHSRVLAVLLASAAVAHCVRWLLWRPWKTLRTPLVWALHVAYVWIPLHLVMRSAVALGWPHASAATHALTVGAIGGLTVAMMTRTALGHTGRRLVAGHGDALIYLLVLSAALVRVAVPVAVAQWTLPAIIISAFLWSAAFLLYALSYIGMLVLPRVDGNPG
jgi:uncharacterized protein involved in response to NO